MKPPLLRLAMKTDLDTREFLHLAGLLDRRYTTTACLIESDVILEAVHLANLVLNQV